MKGEMSMGVIIGAAIALLILVILSVLIFRAGGGVSAGTACESLREGATCIPDDAFCSDLPDYDGHHYVQNRGGACPEGSFCCVPFP